MDPDPTGMFVLILLSIVFALVLSLLSAGLAAVISANAAKIKKMAEDADRRASAAVKLLNDAEGVETALLAGVVLSAAAMTACFCAVFRRLTDQAVAFSGWPPLLTDLLVLAETLLGTLILVTMFHVVPAKVGEAKAEKLLLSRSGFLRLFAGLNMPAAKAGSAFARGLLRAFGHRPSQNQADAAEEEIRMMVDAGEEKGYIEESEKEMINNVFEFDDITAGEVMTHRTDIEAVENTAGLDDVLAIAVDQGYSRIPVYEEDLDNIIGIVYVKDLLQYVGKDLPKDFSLAKVMRKTIYIPESKKCAELFKELTTKRMQIAVVVDEYGGTSGIVTMEDLLEAIVGSIEDEYDDEPQDINMIDQVTYEVDGAVEIEEIEELFDIELPEERNYDTVGGLILDHLGYIPDPSEHPTIEVGELALTVLETEERRISRVLIVKAPVSALPENPENSD